MEREVLPREPRADPEATDTRTRHSVTTREREESARGADEDIAQVRGMPSQTGERFDESLSLGDGDETSTRFFSSAPPGGPAESLVIEEWSSEPRELSPRQVRRRAALKRVALLIVALSGLFVIVLFGYDVFRSNRPHSPASESSD